MQFAWTMARDVRGPGAPAVPAEAESARRAWWLIGAASALGVFLLSHPYWGIVHDAELYVGRAMADADPDGLGRDIFFSLEGQSAFSIYPRLSGAFLRILGPGPGALILTLAGLCFWIAALSGFAARLASGRLLWASIVTAAVVPSYYGQVLRYSEQFATPRLPAEAAVLAGLAALAAGRRWLCLAIIAAGAAIHPIMAAPALGVWALVLAREDKRWRFAMLGSALALAAAGLAGVPVADRLFQIMDPAWAEALAVNAYLFPSKWPGTAWSEAFVRSATIVLALRFIPSTHARAVLGSIVVVAALALVVTLVAADFWLVVLVVQAQPWRALWLLSLGGALTFPIAVLGLWRSGGAGQVALACLTLAWLLSPLSTLGAAGAAGALLVSVLQARRPALFSEPLGRMIWFMVAILGVVIELVRIAIVLPVWTAKPPGSSMLGHVWLFWILTIPIVLAAIWFASRQAGPSRATAGVGAALLLGLAALVWDDRTPHARLAERYLPDSELSARLPAAPGEILWMRGAAGQAWRLAGRPNWASYAQGGSIVFSPELGAIWRDRMDRLVAAGLADTADRLPWAGEPPSVLHPSRGDLESFCRAADAPDAIVVPLNGSVLLPDGFAATTYRFPAPGHDLVADTSGLHWRSTYEAAIVPCSARRQSGQFRGTLPG